MNRQIAIAAGNPMILGANKTDEGYNFAVVSREDRIELNLYEKGSECPSHVIELDERYKYGDIFAVRISGLDFGHLEYNYRKNGKYLLDPYAMHVCDVYEFGQSVREGGYRSKVMLENYDWEGDRTLNIPYDETVIYKLHVRGFTKHTSSKVKHKGTYAGVAEKIPYLKELGITAVELMPVFESEEVQKWTESDKNSMYSRQFNGRVNYWGFAKGMYFAPKASYAAKSRDNEDYTVEFKDMVKALHKAGIEVILEMFFPYDAGINMICDCVRHWIVEYHIDGIHLNCSDAVSEAVANDPLLSRVKMFTTYWNIGNVKRSYKNLANYNQGFMNCARKLLKGDENQLNEFVSRVKSNAANTAVINYITNNNGFTLMDLVSFDRKHNENNGENNRDGEDFNNSWNCGVEGKCRKKKIMDLRRRQIKNAMMMLLLSQGTPLIMAGDEFGNSQSGNNNPYCQDNEVSWLNWRNLDSNRELFEFFKALVAFRKSHKILHMEEPLRDMDYYACGYPDVSYHGDNAWFAGFENYNRHLGIMYCGKYAKNTDGNEDDFIYVAYNLHWEKHTLALPFLPDGKRWHVEFDSSGGAHDEDVINAERHVTANERSIVVLTGR
ncbi:MAG: alpha-amylase family glycosyl hydrolase [Alistipes sp.]|nr:alpha-amylase family glycosyl hydrolase [Alistipes sp.]